LDRWIKTGRIGHHRWGGRVWVSDEQIEEFTAASERSRWEQPELPFEVAR
jgi:hypothetical protein